MLVLNKTINTYDDCSFVDISTETSLFLLIIARVNFAQSVDAFCALNHWKQMLLPKVMAILMG